MLRLKNLWNGPDLPSASDYIRSVQALIDALTFQPEELQSPEMPVFRREISALSASLALEATAQDLQSVINSAIESFQKYSLSCAARIGAHLSELKLTMRALTQTVTFLSESRSTVVHQLTFIERQLEQAAELEDIRLLRPKLMQCLELVRDETTRLQSESAVNSELVRSKLSGAPQSEDELPRRLGTLDSVTGLPARQVAQRLIEDKIASGKSCLVALFLPNRLELVNRHHGRAAGDELLLQVAQHLTKSIPPPASICRWSGPAFLALAEVTGESTSLVRAWNTLAAKPLQLNLNLDRRSVLISASSTCVAKPIGHSTDPAKLFQELDAAVDSHR